MKMRSPFQPVLLVLLLVSVYSCADRGTDTTSNDYLFEILPSGESGIRFRNDIRENMTFNAFLYEYVYNGGGVAVGDVNNDGLPDIYFTANMGENALYLNQGNLKFKDITELSKTAGKPGWSTGVNMVDINNDGLLDIYVSRSGPFPNPAQVANELFVNQGIGSDGIPVFKEMASTYGLADTGYGIQSVFFDFDRDGDLDMYQMNHNPQPTRPDLLKSGRKRFSEIGDKFYVNENGKFIDKTRETGIYSNAISYGLGVGISDLNHDGWPDIYVSNDYEEHDYMYINQKNGTFKEVVKQATRHISNFSMGNDIADFDNDGLPDIITLDMVSEDNYGIKTSMPGMNPDKFNRLVNMGMHYQYMYNTLQRHTSYIDSTGTPYFSEIGQMAGISNTDWSWAPLLADFDKDGKKDLFITNGIKRDFRNKDYHKKVKRYIQLNPDFFRNPKKMKDLVEKTPHRSHKNYMYQNEGGLRFAKRSEEWIKDNPETYSNGAAYVDLDNDGDLDIVINNVDAEAMIMVNRSERNNNNQFLKLRFKGLPKNTMGIGAKVVVFSGKEKQVYENYPVRGYQSSVPPEVVMGLPEGSSVDSLYVIWPTGEKQRFAISETNREYDLVYDSTKVKKLLPVSENRLFVRAHPASVVHRENAFDDYAFQVLLPHKLSQFGPAVAVGDVNGDGLDDLYFGQSTGTASVLYLQNKSGKFIREQIFESDKIFEDTDAVFFDFDRDGDLDLYVCSGGNEFEKDAAQYRDRLYENKSGKFIKRDDLIPGITGSTSVVKVADFDNDGHPELFVGEHFIPRDYPAPASGHILKFRNGKYVDVTSDIAPELKDIGLINDAVWSDVDGDNDLDLIVVGEWMGPVIFENNQGKFTKKDDAYLKSLSGWYFSIAEVDIDNDGDMDYLLGNLGENYKYKASEKEPFEVFYTDFDRNGKKDIVLSYYNFGELFPVRGRECSSQQVPKIKEIMPTYHDFGKATVADIYGNENLKNALHLQSFNFKSGLLLNNGDKGFEFKAFPDLAQISSINTFLVNDVDGDGFKDVILAGNLFTSEIETPRNDAGYGLLLHNTGNAMFTPVEARKSGIFLPYDVKRLRPLKIGGQSAFISGNNDGPAIFYVKSTDVQTKN